MRTEKNYHIRYHARLAIETLTPLAIGSGEVDGVTDQLIIKDANNLPYIPGASLAGVFRHAILEIKGFDEEDKTTNDLDRLFGHQKDYETFDKSGKKVIKKGQGSRIRFSSAYTVDKHSNVIDGPKLIDDNDAYFSLFKKLPERDHVRITHKGGADTIGHGKFEEEVVFKGSRFVFDLEMLSEGGEEDQNNWKQILSLFHSEHIRLGSGTRKGMGDFKVNSLVHKRYDLNQQSGMDDYLNLSSKLSDPLPNPDSYEPLNKEDVHNHSNKWKDYSVKLKAVDFFYFGAGFGDEEVDMISKKEKVILWNNENEFVKLEFKESRILIPATSVKGAISHRLAFHYNQLTKTYMIDNDKEEIHITELDSNQIISQHEFNLSPQYHSLNSLELDQDKINQSNLNTIYKESQDWKDWEEDINELSEELEGRLSVGENNKAVVALFGIAKNDEGNKENGRGHVIFSDVYLEAKKATEKVFEHVAIDRYTGGAINGALFSEKVTYYPDEFNLKIFLNTNAFDKDDEDGNIEKAFNRTIEDLIGGRLALGGLTHKGNGLFTGKYLNEENNG